MSCELNHLSSKQHNSTVTAATIHAKSSCYLRRSNAIRIRSRSYHILSGNSNCYEVQQIVETNQNEDHLTILDQIKRGVRLHSIRGRPRNEILRKSSQQIKKSPSSDRDDENLAEILAKALKKRNMVMQQTDEESELSSIDSQPEQQYRMLEESLSNDEEEEVDCENSEAELNVSGSGVSDFSYVGNVDCFGGRIDLIMRL